MDVRLYVVHGSHPCATVEKALALKGIPYRKVEWPPPFHAPIQRLLFGRRTVPGLRLDGEKVIGSRAILRRLEEIRSEPPLYPAGGPERERVEEAERWGEEVFQPLGRRLLWPAMRRNPAAMASYSEHSQLPLPAPAIRLSAPLITRAEIALNRATDEAVRADLQALPGYLDRIDAWLQDGLLGGDPPNAADLQIASTLRLLTTVEDVRPLIEPRPAAAWARRLFPEVDGRMPAGSLPPSWIPA
jgi:glutathione S-transferase